MKKIFVLDTNVLLHTANALESFADNNVVLPMAVIEELDKFKTQSSELGRNARAVIRRIDELRAKGSLKLGVAMDNGGSLRIATSVDLPAAPGLDLNAPDNRILRVAYSLYGDGDDVRFVSKDINARVKADALGIFAEDFEKEKVNIDELFNGYREVMVPQDVVDGFYKEKVFTYEGLNACANEFVLMRDDTNPKHTALARCLRGNEFVHLNQKFETSWKIKPRNKEQRLALELLLDSSIQLVTLVGQAGTGKTLLALAAALQDTLGNKVYSKILVSRPIVPMGKDIGYLPGDKDEKLTHWMQPIFDNLAYLLQDKKDGDSADDSGSVLDRMHDLQQQDIIELEALTYIRGRSISHQYMIIDEAQNLTPHEIKTIVSRAGEGTKVVLTGDPYQIDNPYLDSASNGLSYAIERLKNEEVHGHITLRNSERSVLSGIAADLL